ncbi:hypothetical protein SOM11_12550, partial [Frigoribacterium sp. CFBP9039]|nr:hypothetical protein [Frigoribacterium sp. CFBP9039]
APVGTGTFDGATGTFAFPITGGNVDYYDPSSDVRPYVQGELDHDGSGLSLTAGDTTVELTDFRIDPGESKLYGTVSANGEVVVEDAYLFNLWGGTLKPRRRRAAERDLQHRRRPGRDARRRREDHRRHGITPSGESVTTAGLAHPGGAGVPGGPPLAPRAGGGFSSAPAAPRAHE